MIKVILLLKIIYIKKTENIIKTIKLLIYNQVDKNGYHKSNNPSYQAEFINQLHEIKNIFLFFNIKVPDQINYQIYNMSSAFINLFHKDNSIALFNGSNDSNYLQFKKINNQIQDLKPKKLEKITNGIGIYSDKEKKIFLDVVQPTNKFINQNLHAGTLSFEMSSFDEKIITNCGSIEKRFGQKPRYLRYSAAHSTIILDNTNISELSEKNSYKRIPKKILLNIEEDSNYFNWIATHDGYILKYKKIIKRKLIISKKNNQIMGEDSIISTKYQSGNILYNIRFHLTPICSGVLTNDKKSVFIKTRNNQSWVFKANRALSFEDSICILDGKKIEKTKQIVISNYVKNANNTEKWSLTKV